MMKQPPSRQQITPENTIERQAELFQQSGFAPEIKGVDWEKLPPIVRLLMSADGTVTKSLEAFFWEPVRVLKTYQSEIQAPIYDTCSGDHTRSGNNGYLSDNQLSSNKNCSGLEVFARDEPLWLRQVQLQGARSGRVYAQAESFIAHKLLPSRLRTDLEQGELGIGGLVRELNLETYREITVVGQVPQVNSEAAVPEKVWRTYSIYYRGRVLMQITETFNVEAF